MALSTAAAAVVAFGDLDRQTVGLLVIALTVSLLMCGVHVAPALALPGLLGIWNLAGPKGVASLLEEIPHSSVASWSLSVIPMFILMGLVLQQTGITAVLFDAARQWIGRVPGGLAVATVVSGAGMSAGSGSTLGVTFALGRIGIPEMIKARYSPRLATGSVAMAGTLKLLIPPSITMVIYAGIAQTPVGPQLLAGVVPGVILAVLFTVVIMIWAKVRPVDAPAVDMSGYTTRSRLRAAVRTWPLVLLAVIIIGGMYSGVATATEAGALAAFTAIVLGAWSIRRDGPRQLLLRLGTALGHTVAAVAAIMLLLVGVHIMTRVAALSGLAQELTGFVSDLGLSRVGLLLCLVVVFVVLGMFMDELAMMLLTVPILIPVLNQLDIDLLWFGVFMGLMCEIGMVAPPVGLLSFIVHGIAQDREVNLGVRISLGDVFRGVMWFVFVAIVFVVVLIAVPQIALWLPQASMG
ncbi:TRAP transporter large permease [Pseudonocardia ailaonensis]|uniref:TRAP transporter large permease n=1 Tax=Pseudonocardia ailaonensis TaxID=367279 RepID=UPI0031E26810